MLAHLEQQAAGSRLLLQPLSVPVASTVESGVVSIPFRMSPEDQARFEKEWAERLAALAPVPLTAGQQLALFRLRKSALSEAIVDELEASTVRAGSADYAGLVKRGWARRSAAGHEITVIGANRADALAKAAARELGVHFFFIRGTRYQSFVACTCGKFIYAHNHNEGHERTAFAKRTAEHLTAVGQARAGILPGSHQ